MIAAGVWGGKRALLKNRDRKYIPKLTIVHELLDGVEVAYLRDEVTDWCEGLNQYGIGVVNAALAVGLDEAEGTSDRDQRNNKKDDGDRILKALACKTLDDAVTSICEYKKGLEGHTFLSNPKRSVSVELVGKACVVKELDPSDIYVRTNHGRDTGGTGYTDGEGYLASAARKEKATQILRQSKNPLDLGPDLMANRSEEDPHTLNDPVRDAKKMKTTSQMVVNLTDLELDLFVIPDKCEYKGLDNRLPEGHKPKISVRVFGYRDKGAKMVELDPENGGPKGKPRKVASAHDKSIALMKFLSGVARREGAAEHIYVVGGAVRNFILGVPVKDIDVVVDSVNLGRDSEWFAKEVAKAIPVASNLTTNQYGVAILTVKGDWVLDGIPMKGEVIEIANARKESYEGVGGKGKGYKPTDVSPATIREDVFRREFTFNTLLWRLLDLANGPEKAEIIDLTGLGRQHLEEKLISTPVDPDKTFSDDPTRQLRILKFLLRYDLKIAPEVVASVRRNAPKLKNMPWEAVAKILVGDILDSPKASKGLKVLGDLGMLEVLVEMIQETPAFATYLTRQFANGNHPVGLLLELADIGIAGRVLDFLTPDQRARFREVSSTMEDAEARKYLETLRKPSVDSLALIQEFNLQGSDRGILVPTARKLLLEDPSLANHEVKLNDRMRERLSPMRKTADLNPPLGTYGGPCKVVNRILENVSNPRLRDKMIMDAQVGDLSNADAAKVYPVIEEHGSGFKTFKILPHAQYRMDYRSISVKAVASALDSYLRWLLELKENSPSQYLELRESMERTTWIDPKSKLKLVLDFIGGHIVVVTAYWKGREDPPPMSCGIPKTRLASDHFSWAQEVEILEALAADIQVILDTYENTVPMPHVGRIAALTLASQKECFAKCEHALRHCERVINMTRAHLQSNPSDSDASAALQDAQFMYEKFQGFRARSREMLSAMAQKILPTELKNTVTVVLNGVREALNYPNSATVLVNPRFLPCEVKGRPVEGLVFDAYVTVYPLPGDNPPSRQQFVFTQATMGDDLNLYMVAIDRETGEPTKPVVVGADAKAVVKKVLGYLKGWTNPKG